MILKQYPCKEEFKELALKYNVIPICAEILADTETPVSILQKFHSPDNSLFLLESVEGGEHWARYSFMGLSAKSQVKVFEDHIAIEESPTIDPNTKSRDNTAISRNISIDDKNGVQIKKIPHKGDPIGTIKEITSHYNPADIKGLPRFWSGLTGYMTYEMVSFFEDIASIPTMPDNRPYAHFMIPDAMIIFDNMNHTLTCMSICYIEDRDIDSCFNESYRHLEAIIDRVNTNVVTTINKSVLNQTNKSTCIKSESQPFSLVSETDHDTYIQGVKKIKEHIVAGDIIQAVYSQPFSSDTAVDPVMIYRTQRYINPSPYMFFMNLGDIAIAGSSPETMVRLENRTATLRPIAGTRARGKNEQEDRNLADELLNDEKERAEHLMLVDLGRNDLGRVAEVGTVQVTDLMFVERYSHVMHLVSNITCEVKKEFDAWDLLKATFPAGTLSGAPKIRAMEIIADIEKRPRGIYGGAAGYISFSGNMDLAITIRTAVIEKNGKDISNTLGTYDNNLSDKIDANNQYGKMVIQAGAGIVFDSDPEKEYQECINKAKSVEKAFCLALISSNNTLINSSNTIQAGSCCNKNLDLKNVDIEKKVGGEQC
ncbi:MAG: chorismate-binding protein [Desulfamplus sp.]|nr:chorismate-binding protein [Desulfamplus sp.]